MASFSSQVQYKTGDVTAYATQMPTWLADGVKDVVDRVLAINPAYAEHFTTYEGTISFSGTTVASPHILQVYRNTASGKSLLAPQVPMGMAAVVTDSNSVYAASESHPVHWVSGGKVYMWPSPTAGGSIWYCAYGAVNDGAGTIATFPSALYEGVVSFASIRSQEYRMGLIQAEIEALETTASSITTAIGLQASAIVTAKNDIGTVAEDLADYQAAFDSYEIDRAAIVSALTGYISDIGTEVGLYTTQAGNASSALAASLVTLGSALSTYTGAIATVQSTVSGYVTEMTAVNSAVAAYVDTDEDVELASAKAGQASVLNARLQTKLSESSFNDATFSSTVKTELEKVQTNLQEFGVDTSKTNTVLSSIAAKISATMQKSALADAALSAALRNVEYLFSQIAGEFKKIEASLAAINGYNAQMSSIAREVELKNASLGVIGAAVARLSQEYAAFFQRVGGVTT